MAYLLQYLTTEFLDLDEVLEAKPDVSHIFPFCLLPKWKNGRALIMRCKAGVLQYTVVRPITTIIALITQFTHVYHEGKFTANSAWLYLTMANSFSQGVAMYCLVLFYKATKEELHHLKPIPKFLCIKAIVFFLFWQQVLIAGLVAVGVITKDNTSKWPEFSAQDIATGLQDLIICIEMFLFAIAHYYSFSHKPYVDYAQGHQNLMTSFRQMWDVSDVRDDVVDHVRTAGVTATEVVTRPLRKKPQGNETEKTPLLKEIPESPDGGGPVLTPCTPPVHLSIEDFYNISQQEELLQQQQQHLENAQINTNNSSSELENATGGGASNGLGGDRPLIDFASENVFQDNDKNKTEASSSSSKNNKMKKPNTKHHSTSSLFESGESVKTVESINALQPSTSSSLTSASKFLSPAAQQQKISMDDTLSTHTFESVSDITDISISRPANGSMYNYAQFSDTDTADTVDTVSHSSQKSEIASQTT